MKTDSLHYCYRIDRSEVDGRLQQIGFDLRMMIGTFAKTYGTHPAYGDLVRVFNEQYRVNEEQVELRAPAQISGSTLQSPDDPEATYRKKGNEAARGYVANISETCDPQNELQLITAVSVEPNATDDQQLLADDLDRLCERTELKELITDGGYLGETSAEAFCREVGGAEDECDQGQATRRRYDRIRGVYYQAQRRTGRDRTHLPAGTSGGGEVGEEARMLQRRIRY